MTIPDPITTGVYSVKFSDGTIEDDAKFVIIDGSPLWLTIKREQIVTWTETRSMVEHEISHQFT